MKLIKWWQSILYYFMKEYWKLLEYVCVCDLLPKNKHNMEYFQHVQHSSVLVEKQTPCHVDTKCVLYATGSTFPLSYCPRPRLFYNYLYFVLSLSLSLSLKFKNSESTATLSRITEKQPVKYLELWVPESWMFLFWPIEINSTY